MAILLLLPSTTQNTYIHYMYVKIYVSSWTNQNMVTWTKSSAPDSIVERTINSFSEIDIEYYTYIEMRILYGSLFTFLVNCLFFRTLFTLILTLSLWNFWTHSMSNVFLTAFLEWMDPKYLNQVIVCTSKLFGRNIYNSSCFKMKICLWRQKKTSMIRFYRFFLNRFLMKC